MNAEFLDPSNFVDFKPEAILWNERDFQADKFVHRLTPRQRAMYRTLLMECYFGDCRPYIKADDPDLWIHADADSPQQWEENKSTVLAKFTVAETDKGTWLVNKRVVEEWQLTIDRLKKKQAAGYASAISRKGKILKKGETLTPVKDDLTPVSPEPPENQKENQKEKENQNQKGVNGVLGTPLTPVKRDGFDFFRKRTGHLITPEDLPEEIEIHGTEVTNWVARLMADDPAHDWTKIKQPIQFFKSRFSRYLEGESNAYDRVKNEKLAAQYEANQKANQLAHQKEINQKLAHIAREKELAAREVF